ncbi:D-alanyl-D-alanine carboxypeptidase/D-alanyl-D-alanine-endopeptidase [Qipengyuania sediminis]|uniref:D-alanyl-D-alanine carboxypeptidase/D-alanyl-D-alanine endopeptidase n=1 Tax=Qipengyuania sediminis TaxID=1532023 RepID=UPI001059569F|nr:D-alanyl-D-alanine carboxypeptidase/D-alanyl-D-alanine-endopeptidase [Qipengyuania sediminis]
MRNDAVMRLMLAALLALAPLPLAARPGPEGPQGVSAILAEAGPGTRWGLVVADAEGREIVAINPEGRFVPASNTKLLTTAAALWAEARGAGPRMAESGAAVRIDDRDAVLTGRGDPRMSAAIGCITNCLAVLADAVARRTRQVRDVIGDATLFPDQRWSPGMSWNNIPTSSGTAIAALSVDDNEISAGVVPGVIGKPPAVSANGYYAIDNRALTIAGDGESLAFDRLPGSRTLIVTGTIGAARAPVIWRLGVDDPAHYAAWQLAGMLRARGVRVTGEVRSRYRPLIAGEGAAPPAPAAGAPLATLTPQPLGDTVRVINKASQNLYAELVLRRLALHSGKAGDAGGQAAVTAMLAEAGIVPAGVSLSDGSGMSTYNRVAPRGMVRLLQWAARQPWGAELKASLPVGGADGTLARRFAGTPLAGRIFAKTGTLNATNALAGYLIAASGKELIFAIYANDVPEGVRATAIMDRALLALAAAN